MIIENQVCNKNLAKRLEELGVKQESLFYYNENGKILKNPNKTPFPKFSAFTVSELGEMLPYPYDGTFKTKKGWMIGDPLNLDNYFIEPTEADARAKMLIYLLENKLIEVEK